MVNQTNAWCLLFGEQYRKGRSDRLGNMLELHQATPELFAIAFLIASWGAFTYDFFDRMFDGVRRLGQFCRPDGDIAEIRRLALNRHPDGGLIWQNPLSFNMLSSRGYWRRNITHRLEAGVGKVGYGVALQKIIGPGRKANRGAVVGAINKQLISFGTRLADAARSTMIQNFPGKALSGVSL